MTSSFFFRPARLLLLLLGATLVSVAGTTHAAAFVSQRPPVEKRKFHSDAVEAQIVEISKKIGDPELAWIFQNCYPNTLDTTVDFTPAGADGKPDTFIITGDIDAMWLRDSSAQVDGYLSLCASDPKLAQLVAGLIHRQAKCILLDPYANAFYKDSSRVSQWKSDNTDMKPGVHERKYELDSMCYCIRLASQYYDITKDATPFDAEWLRSVRLAVATMQEQQRKTDRGSYHFARNTETQTDTVAGAGWGNPVKPNGMICSVFRNSDDSATYLFNIPENLFAVVSLRHLASLLEATHQGADLVPVCRSLADEAEAATLKYGIVHHPKYGDIYAYECDGYGNVLLMDDAGLPSLVSIPYLGYKTTDDPVYVNTRRFALSADNPYFQKGVVIEGTGSPHTPGPRIWPMGIINRAMTSSDPAEISQCLKWLKLSSAGSGFMHESIDKDDPKQFSRAWFAWVNNLFGELIIKLAADQPALLEH
jgi:uncharacterized protein